MRVEGFDNSMEYDMKERLRGNESPLKRWRAVEGMLPCGNDDRYWSFSPDMLESFLSNIESAMANPCPYNRRGTD